MTGADGIAAKVTIWVKSLCFDAIGAADLLFRRISRHLKQHIIIGTVLHSLRCLIPAHGEEGST